VCRWGLPVPGVHVVGFQRHSDAPVLTAIPVKSFESATTWL
jgi:hypothetical protein